MTRVITIAREYGSGATSIAGILADRLGWRVLDHEVVAQVLEAARFVSNGPAEWQGDLWFRKLVQEVTWNGGIQRLAEGDEFSVRTRVIEEAARMGDCLIIGRGAQCILRGYHEVFHVFLQAPLRLRVERTAHQFRDRGELELTINERDTEQAEFVRDYFCQDWRDPRLYDLMIDTRHGFRAAAEAIFAAAGLRPSSLNY